MALSEVLWLHGTSLAFALTGRALIALHSAHPALRSLAFQPVDSADRFESAYLRHTGEETILVVLSLGNEATSELAPSL